MKTAKWGGELRPAVFELQTVSRQKGEHTDTKLLLSQVEDLSEVVFNNMAQLDPFILEGSTRNLQPGGGCQAWDRM